MNTNRFLTVISFAALAWLAAPVLAQQSVSPDAERVFALQVLPILQMKCFACHGEDAKKIKGGLDLLAFLIVIAIDEIMRGFSPRQGGAVLLQALRCLGNGFILTSFLWAAALSTILEGRAMRACVPLTLAAVFSLFGLMHSPLPDGSLAWPTDVWDRLAASPVSQLQFMSPFHWAAGYLLSVGVIVFDWLFIRKQASEAVPAASEPAADSQGAAG